MPGATRAFPICPQASEPPRPREALPPPALSQRKARPRGAGGHPLQPIPTPDPRHDELKTFQDQHLPCFVSLPQKKNLSCWLSPEAMPGAGAQPPCRSVRLCEGNSRSPLSVPELLLCSREAPAEQGWVVPSSPKPPPKGLSAPSPQMTGGRLGASAVWGPREGTLLSRGGWRGRDLPAGGRGPGTGGHLGRHESLSPI